MWATELTESMEPMRTLPSPSAEPSSQTMPWVLEASPRKKLLLLLLVQGFVVLLGLLDYATGVTFQFSIIYLAPISFAALRGGLSWGVLTSVTSTAVWFAANKYGGADFGTGWIACWNALTRLLGFSLMAAFLARS